MEPGVLEQHALRTEREFVEKLEARGLVCRDIHDRRFRCRPASSSLILMADEGLIARSARRPCLRPTATVEDRTAGNVGGPAESHCCRREDLTRLACANDEPAGASRALRSACQRQRRLAEAVGRD